jgi:DNA-binding LacI/PurR family transcriptional regulator
MLNGSPPHDSKLRVPARMIDVARRAGVSRTIVWKVLGNGGGNARVSAETAARVRRAAEELHYHPNQAARQLAGKRSDTIGAFGNWFLQSHLRVFSWLTELATARGLRILAGQSHTQLFQQVPHSFEDFVRDHQARGSDGLVFVALNNDPIWPEAARALANVPHVISLLGNPGIAGASCVLSDVAEGMRLAVEHLDRQGRRKIVQILEDDRGQINRQRYAAMKAVHEALGRPYHSEQLCLATADWTNDTDFAKYLALAEELVVQRGADAIIADNDFTAVRLLKAFNRLGRRVPDDVAVVGWGNEFPAPWVIPGLTTVNNDIKSVAAAALDLLALAWEHPAESPPPQVVIRPQFIVRESA